MTPAWLSEIPKIDPRIRTVHLVEYKAGNYVVADHAGREDITDFYGTEERIHQFLTLAPAVLIGSSGTIRDVVGSPELISIVYEKVIVAYVPIDENIVAISLSHDGYSHVPEIAQKIRESYQAAQRASAH